MPDDVHDLNDTQAPLSDHQYSRLEKSDVYVNENLWAYVNNGVHNEGLNERERAAASAANAAPPKGELT